MSFTIKRYDFVKRAMVVLKCKVCGTTVIRCPRERAAYYQHVLTKHQCPAAYREAVAS